MAHTAQDWAGRVAPAAGNAELRAARRHLVEMVDESIACTEECHEGWVAALNQFDREHPGLAFDVAGEPTAAEAAWDAEMAGAF